MLIIILLLSFLEEVNHILTRIYIANQAQPYDQSLLFIVLNICTYIYRQIQLLYYLWILLHSYQPLGLYSWVLRIKIWFLLLILASFVLLVHISLLLWRWLHLLFIH